MWGLGFREEAKIVDVVLSLEDITLLVTFQDVVKIINNNKINYKISLSNLWKYSIHLLSAGYW